jgi:hypothetical protein
MLFVGTVLVLISFAASLFILVHAFQRSVGTGFMVLLVPGFIVFYAFAQFEHRYKGIIVATWLGLFVPGALLQAFGTQALVEQVSPLSPSL